jgi:3-oxoadipate enol-lactonase/4-carboxymuconolactone decarboxylase
MTVPAISGIRLSKHDGGAHPLLVFGPSLGTSAASLWSHCAQELADEFDVIGWDLPGHGVSPAPADAFSMAELAEGVLAFIQRYGISREVYYAGDSIGGAVGLQLVLDHPDMIAAAILMCTGARIGTPSMWLERAAFVRAHGTSAMVDSSVSRWFAAGFVDREPQIVADLVQSLCGTDGAGYAATCEALAGFDLRHRLGEIATPVYAVAGSEDQPTPVGVLREIADGVRDGRLLVLGGVAHLAPAEAPAAAARVIRETAANAGRQQDPV